MAKTILIVDDIDGTPDAQEVQFSYAGTAYTIDLAEANRTALEAALKPYIDAASKSDNGRAQRSRVAGDAGAVKTKTKASQMSSRSSKPSSGRSTRGRKPATAGLNLADVRSWAVQNGYEVSSRGRVPKSVVDAFEAARSEQPTS